LSLALVSISRKIEGDEMDAPTKTLNKRFCEVFGETFRVDGASLTGAETPADVRGWDSLGHLRLVSALEDAFSLQFTDDEVMAMESVAKIDEVLTKRGVTQ
jgi:acyl carrier protein